MGGAPERPRRKVKEYPGEAVTVTFEPGRCLHAAECVRGLPAVFDTKRRPWVEPDAAPAGETAEVIRRCPSCALQYAPTGAVSERPAPAAESPDRPTVAARRAGGGIVIRGDLRVEADGEARPCPRAPLD
ncbi:MAG: hypothetical protein GEV11_26470 [Streptosporangiales bacterium]|nr:hypothetical protein [Streptosporangiales bacterium]